MPKLPDFKTEEELIDWIENNDLSVHMADMESADQAFPVLLTEFPTRPLDLRLRADFLAAVETLADRRGMPYQQLIYRWLLEKLNQEAPDLVPQPHS